MRALLLSVTTAVVTVVAALGVATTAQATQLVADGGSPAAVAEMQQLVNESQEPTPAGTVKVVSGLCPNPLVRSCSETAPWIPLSETQIWVNPATPEVILHELGHVSWSLIDPEPNPTKESILSNNLSPIQQEFEQIVGKVGRKWQAPISDPYTNASPEEEWANTLMTCSWHGRVTKGPRIITPGFYFVLSASQYNQVCAFFMRVLVGPKFDPPTAATLPPIPYNYAESMYCGAKPSQIANCGSKYEGFTPAQLRKFLRQRAKYRKGKRTKKHR